jgi:hypothetical protein
MFEGTTPKQRILFGAIVIFLLVTWQIGILISHVGKTKVSVTVIPKDARITLNHKSFSSKTAYLHPGEYTFAASKEGWKTDTQIIDVGKKKVVVNLLPAPNSSEAYNWLKNNLKTQLEREKLGGENVAMKSNEVLQKNPIIGRLPYTDLTGPFSIDYGPSPTRRNSVFLIISNSSPAGRQKALDWIRRHGQDPTNLEIRYYGFSNPITPFEDAQ